MPPSFPPAQKRLGQNFLIDPNIVRKIVALAELTRYDVVLEIGPGRGVLTEALAQAAGRVVAVEIDPLLHRLLAERQPEWPNVELVCADAMTYGLDRLPSGTIVVANLPYYISTPLLFRLLEQRARFPRLVLMLQEEVVDRLVAKPDSESYGVLSVMAQYAAEITKAFRVSAQCFRPRPEVGSAVALLNTKAGIAGGEEEARTFASLVKAAFAHRRKQLVNSLRDEGYATGPVQEALVRIGLADDVRAEILSPEQFLTLSKLLAVPSSRRE